MNSYKYLCTVNNISHTTMKELMQVKGVLVYTTRYVGKYTTQSGGLDCTSMKWNGSIHYITTRSYFFIGKDMYLLAAVLHVTQKSNNIIKK